MPTIGWIDTDTLSGYVKDHLQKAQSEALKPYWDSIISRAATAAHGDIVSALVGRGYLIATINQWDRRVEFQLDIGAWWALKRIGVLNADALGTTNLDTLDRRPELRGKPPDILPVVITVDGVAADTDGTYGGVHAGAYDTADDLFVMQTANEDGRVGQTTRF